MSAQAKKAFAPTTLGVVVLAAALAAFLAPIPARSGTSTFRIDPEALSGRITQFLEGESEVATGTSQAGVKFGNNIMLSDEHFANRLISQTEPSIAVNPANPNNLVAGFHDLFPKTQDFVCRFTFTTDGGSNWTRGGATPLQTSGNFCSDPAIAADASGTFFYSYLDINFGAQHSDVDVAKSTDGGQTFSTFTVAVKSQTAVDFPDKEYIAADAGTNSPFKGNIYVTWTDFLNPQSPSALDNGQIKVVVSRDGGSTWSAPLPISQDALAPEAISGSNPVVAPDGTVFVFYADFIQGTGPLTIRCSKSTNGGVSFDPCNTAGDGKGVVASGLPSPGRFRLKNADP